MASQQDSVFPAPHHTLLGPGFQRDYTSQNVNERYGDVTPTIKGVNFPKMANKPIAVFSHWLSKSKLRRFTALFIFWIIIDQLFGYISRAIFGWSRQSWTHSIFYGVWMALWFTIVPIFGKQHRTDS